MKLKPEDLKRFAELGGWREIRERDVHFGHWSGIDPADNNRRRGPYFPDDLAACFDALERYCEQRSFWYSIHQARDRSLYVKLIRDGGTAVEDADDDYEDRQWSFPTKQEAIINAVLKASTNTA